MNKTIFMALFAALPLMAQEPAPADCCTPGAPCCKPGAPCCAPAKPEGKPCCGKKMHHGPRHHQMSEEQKAEMKAKFMEKFDTNKDGQIDDQEKEAIKAEFAKHHQGKPCCGKHQGPRPEGKPCCGKPHGPRHHQMTEEQKAEMKAKFMEKFDTNKDGQIDDQEKEAIKAEFAKHHQGKPGCGKPHGPRHHGKPGCCPCKKGEAPAPEAPEAPAPEAPAAE